MSAAMSSRERAEGHKYFWLEPMCLSSGWSTRTEDGMGPSLPSRLILTPTLASYPVDLDGLEAYTRTLSGSLSWSDVANENDSMAFEFMGPGIAMAAVG